MSTVLCPAGHTSHDLEWCDTCGARIGGPPPVSSPDQAQGADPVGPNSTGPNAAGRASAPERSAPVPCPHCGVSNPADNLFCEACGYDFTTGQAPPVVVLGGAPAAQEAPAPEVTAPETPAASEVPAASAAAEGPGAPTSQWLVVVEVSPEWYALKGALAEQPCPPASTSTVRLTKGVSLVGRSSQSRGIHPEVTLDQDTGVSRRHAQFVIDGNYLSVVDLSSTNGTFLVDGGDAPSEDTQPLDPGVSTAVDDGDQVFVGAWTKLTVRRA